MFHCRSDVTRDGEVRGLREQDTEGRNGEAGRKGARPVPTGGERQSGMFDPRCGERWCVCLLHTNGFANGKVGRALEPTDGLTVFVDRAAFVRHRRAGDVSSQAFGEETLASVCGPAGMTRSLPVGSTRATAGCRRMGRRRQPGQARAYSHYSFRSTFVVTMCKLHDPIFRRQAYREPLRRPERLVLSGVGPEAGTEQAGPDQLCSEHR